MTFSPLNSINNSHKCGARFSAEKCKFWVLHGFVNSSQLDVEGNWFYRQNVRNVNPVSFKLFELGAWLWIFLLGHLTSPPQFLNIVMRDSASFRSIPFLSYIEPVFVWNVPLVSLIFLKRSLVFPILLFSSISLHWSLRKAFLSPCYSLELCIQMFISFFFSFAFHFSSFHSYL